MTGAATLAADGEQADHRAAEGGVLDLREQPLVRSHQHALLELRQRQIEAVVDGAVEQRRQRVGRLASCALSTRRSKEGAIAATIRLPCSRVISFARASFHAAFDTSVTRRSGATSGSSRSSRASASRDPGASTYQRSATPASTTNVIAPSCSPDDSRSAIATLADHRLEIEIHRDCLRRQRTDRLGDLEDLLTAGSRRSPARAAAPAPAIVRARPRATSRRTRSADRDSARSPVTYADAIKFDSPLDSVASRGRPDLEVDRGAV